MQTDAASQKSERDDAGRLVRGCKPGPGRSPMTLEKAHMQAVRVLLRLTRSKDDGVALQASLAVIGVAYPGLVVRPTPTDAPASGET